MADLVENDEDGGGRQRPQLIRAIARDGMPVALTLDGRQIDAIEGDSVLAALLTNGPLLRYLEFGGEARAGFCLMGACQDCWIWTARGERLRACTAPVEAGMNLLTTPPAFTAP